LEFSSFSSLFDCFLFNYFEFCSKILIKPNPVNRLDELRHFFNPKISIVSVAHKSMEISQYIVLVKKAPTCLHKMKASILETKTKFDEKMKFHSFLMILSFVISFSL
jgi:hypothetical protein